MQITNFDDLIQVAKQQQLPQRLLFVFAASSIPDDATELQKEQHARGEGGELTPVLCVDKTPDQIASFAGLAAESQQTGKTWEVAFVAAVDDVGMDDKAVDEAFQRMTQMIKYGTIGSFLAFDAQGDPLQFGAA